MKEFLDLNPRMLIADEGKTLTDGEIYTNVVYLGKDEIPENWQEIVEDNVPKEGEINGE
jgi:hypothetical protein